MDDFIDRNLDAISRRMAELEAATESALTDGDVVIVRGELMPAVPGLRIYPPDNTASLYLERAATACGNGQVTTTQLRSAPS